MAVGENQPELRHRTKPCPACRGDGMVWVGHGLKARELWCGGCHGDGVVACEVETTETEDED